MEENSTEIFEGDSLYNATDITNVSNFSVWLYLEQQLGPQKLPITIVLPITVVYALIFISGCIGNAIVCAVIARNSHFQTPTDYYLFSLAISDLLFLVFGLPNDLKVYWQQYPWGLGEAVCKFRAFIAEMTSYASVLTIVAFTIERYIAICHPLFIQTVSTLPRAIKFITSVWIISSLSALPLVYYAQINYLEYPPGSGKYLEESAYCSLPMEKQNITRPLLETATFVFFLLPLTVILILYIKISIKLRSTKFARMTYTSSSRCSSVASTYSPEVRKTTVRRSVNKMLIAVVIAFFVCWAPFHAQRLLAVYVAPQNWTTDLRMANEVLYYAAGCLYYFSATINPILYSSMSSKYRGAFLSILTCFSNKRKASSVSLFRTTGHLGSDASHHEKELSLRISKQSFEADSSLLDFRSKKYYQSMAARNHLDVPDQNRAAVLNCHYRNRDGENSMSFVKISPVDKHDDVLQQNGCIETEKRRNDFLDLNSHSSGKNNVPDIQKKSLIVSVSEGKCHHIVDESQDHENSPWMDDNGKSRSENDESVV